MEKDPIRLSTHLSFDGTCEVAFRFYERILQGRLVTMLTYGESPLAQGTPADFHGRIIHATLAVGAFELFGADVLPDQAERPQGFCITLSVPHLDRARAVFAALSDGGTVRLPLAETFWSPVWPRHGSLWNAMGDQLHATCRLTAAVEHLTFRMA